MASVGVDYLNRMSAADLFFFELTRLLKISRRVSLVSSGLPESSVLAISRILCPVSRQHSRACRPADMPSLLAVRSGDKGQKTLPLLIGRGLPLSASRLRDSSLEFFDKQFSSYLAFAVQLAERPRLGSQPTTSFLIVPMI